MSQFESEFEEKLYAQRQQKLREIQEIGLRLGLSEAESVYPNRFPAADESLRVGQVPELLSQFDSAASPVSGETLEADKPEFAVAGRLMSHRLQGKAGFAHVQQGGKRLQIYIRKDDVGEDAFTLYKLLDLGDHIGVRGVLMRTRTGELTLKALPLGGRPAISFLTKAMLALPDKYHGLSDIELRYRQRYLDLFTDNGDFESDPPEDFDEDDPDRPLIEPAGGTVHQVRKPAREVFVKRAAILRAIRRFFDARGYLEVETPMMQTIAGGAAARPFTTHHNALDIPLSLRIAPELYLKRLVVGGLDRVYEINRNFRNEGVSTQHNPEFTMLEFYQAYANYHDLIELTQELIAFVAMEVNGTTITSFNGHEIDLSRWTKLSMREAIVKHWATDVVEPPRMEDFGSADLFRAKIQHAHNESLAKLRNFDSAIEGVVGLRKRLQRHEIEEVESNLKFVLEEFEKGVPVGNIIAAVFEYLAEPFLIQPTIIYDFPLAVSPLSKVKPDEPDWVERFEFYIGGFEVGNAFSELNDPEDQRRRFEDQLKERDRGDDEAHAMDEDYVRALSFGLPPTAGEGIGIDRLTMLLTGSRSIRDVILFPLMRPLAKNATAEEQEHTHGESAE